jgi:hypothetical protein
MFNGLRQRYSGATTIPVSQLLNAHFVVRLKPEAR